MASAIVWAIALGLNDGWRGLTDPLVRLQYIRTVPKVGNPFSFLSTFTDRLPGYNIHTKGHPPGMVLVLWALDRVGLGGVGANLALVLAGGAASVAAVMVAVREVAGEAAARAAAPFLVLAPAAIWWSSGDAFFAGVSAWAITLVVLATGTEGRRSDRLALAGGLLFGARGDVVVRAGAAGRTTGRDRHRSPSVPPARRRRARRRAHLPRVPRRRVLVARRAGRDPHAVLGGRREPAAVLVLRRRATSARSRSP